MPQFLPRSRPLILIGFFCLLASTPIRAALSKSEKIQADYAYPSGGSGAAKILSGGEEIVAPTSIVEIREKHREVQPRKGLPKTPSSVLTFEGQNQSPSRDGGFIYKPPDTHIAVGPGEGSSGRLVEVTNSGVTVFDKTGVAVAGPTDLDSFLGLGAIGSPNAAFDPKVIFDSHSGRFFVMILEGKRMPNEGGSGGLSNVHVVVSDGSNPDNLTSDWSFHTASGLTEIEGDGTGPGPGGSYETWFDYPGIGADATRLVLTGNLFDSKDYFRGAKIRVYDKAALLAGTPSFTDIDIDSTVTIGIFTIQPCHSHGTTKNGDFYLINRFGQSAYRLWQLTGPASAPSLVAGSYSELRMWSGGIQLTPGAPQRAAGGGTSSFTLDTLSSRILDAKYRNIGGTESVWCCLSADRDVDGRTEVLWFEIDPNTTGVTTAGVATTPAIRQSGFVDGTSLEAWAFLPAISANSNGDMMICYSESAPSKFVEMRAAARAQSDPIDAIQSSVLIASSAGEYDDFGAGTEERWGDYAACVLDPDDDETFWIAHEVVHSGRSTGNDARWGTRIARMGEVLPEGAPTPTDTPTLTATPFPTSTSSPTSTFTTLPTGTPTESSVPSPTPEQPTSTPALTNSPTETAVPTATEAAPTNSPTPTATRTPTASSAGSETSTPTDTPTPVLPLNPPTLLELIRNRMGGTATSRDLFTRSAYWLRVERR